LQLIASDSSAKARAAANRANYENELCERQVALRLQKQKQKQQADAAAAAATEAEAEGRRL